MITFESPNFDGEWVKESTEYGVHYLVGWSMYAPIRNIQIVED